MSFRYSVYYTIEPRPEFVERLSSYPEPDFAEILLETRLIENEETIGKSSWQAPEHLIRVKLLFLASLLEYSPFQNESEREAVFGSAVISIATFDRWWRIVRFEESGRSEELAPQLKDTIEWFENTGNPTVDEWLNELRGDGQAGGK